MMLVVDTAILIAVLAVAGLALLAVRRMIARRNPNSASRADLSIAAQPSAHEKRKGGKSEMTGNNLFSRLAGVFRSDRSPEPPIPSLPSLPRVEMNYEDERIPDSSKDRVRRILACLAEVETALARETLPGFSGVDIIQLRDEHLPRLIQSYIDIPEAHRAEIFRKAGKSASFILNDSLDQMQKRIDTILRSLAQKDIDTFTNNTRFVDQRYSNDTPFG